ncbi:MAG: LPXTG cell wall anchor domain-containing protein, partial [Patescibacteria group bacterium]
EGYKKESDPVASTVSVRGTQTFGGNLSPQVLGAATELPATGNNTAVLMILLALGVAGFGFKRGATNLESKKRRNS